MRLLLLNTFDLSEESISVENISSWISHLNYTHPERFEAIASKIEDCSLEAELDTVTDQFITTSEDHCPHYYYTVINDSPIYRRNIYTVDYCFVAYIYFCLIFYYFIMAYLLLSLYLYFCLHSVYSLSTFSRFVFLFSYSLVKRPCPYILVWAKYFICPYIFAYIICRKIYFQIGLYF